MPPPPSRTLLTIRLPVPPSRIRIAAPAPETVETIVLLAMTLPALGPD